MVNVADKPITVRRATAAATCTMQAATAEAIRANQISKGDVFQVARLAAIAAAKRTDELIPLCHSLNLDGVEVDFQWLDDCRLRILVQVQAAARTGVEMEALVGASLAALTIYDMCKSSDRRMCIGELVLLNKSGGKHGEFRREHQSADDAPLTT